MSENKRIAKNTAFLYLRMFLVMAVGLFTSRVVLQTLGAEDYGLYSVVGGIVTMFTFLNTSLGAATSRYITIELGRNNMVRLRQVFNAALLTHLLLGVLIVIFSETVGLWFFYNKMVIPESRLNAAFWVYQISIVSCFVSLTQVPYNAVIIAHENMKIYSYVSIVDVVLKLAVVYLLVISPVDKLICYAILQFTCSFGILLFYRIYCKKRYQECQLLVCRDKELYRGMFSFTGSNLIGSLSVMAQGQGLNLLLNMFFGPVVNAARAVAYTVQGAITQFGDNFLTAVRPQIIKQYAVGNFHEMFKLVYFSSNFSFYLLWLLILPISLEADYVLTLWLGEYPEHTVSFLNLIFVLCLIQSLKTPRMTVLHATGEIFLANMTIGLLLCAAFPLAYLFLKMGFAPESVFWAANLTMLLSELLGTIILRKYIKFDVFHYLLNVHARCALVAAVSYVIPYLLYSRFLQPSFVRLLITCCITTISIGVTVWILGMSKDMRIRIEKILKSKLHRIA